MLGQIHRGFSGSTHDMKLEATGLNSGHDHHANPYVDPNLKGTSSEEANFPIIHSSLSPDVVGVFGKEVRLACYVTGLGKNRTISWIRHRDVHLLTVGRYTYTSDQRFSAHHVPLTHFWQLRIRNVTFDDEGRYECQISTTPPLGHTLDLAVVVPHTEVLGGSDMHVDKGSTINLTCVSKFSPSPPPDVIWFHNEEEIGYDSPRGGVSVVIERGIDKTTSHLLVQKATSKDSGIYKCSPVDTVEASINIHVLRGKNPDAWQTNHSPPTGFSHPAMVVFLSHQIIICLLHAIPLFRIYNVY